MTQTKSAVSNTDLKANAREELRRLTKQFLKSGGVIDEIPLGRGREHTGQTKDEIKSAKRGAKARKITGYRPAAGPASISQTLNGAKK